MNTVFEALAHPDRRAVLRLLKRHGELAAGELAEHFATGKPTLSHHLKILTHAGLVDRERRGQFVYYRLNQSVVEDVVQAIFDLLEVGANGAGAATKRPSPAATDESEENER